jgi:hypothetical protein
MRYMDHIRARASLGERYLELQQRRPFLPRGHHRPSGTANDPHLPPLLIPGPRSGDEQLPVTFVYRRPGSAGGLPLIMNVRCATVEANW